MARVSDDAAGVFLFSTVIGKCRYLYRGLVLCPFVCVDGISPTAKPGEEMVAASSGGEEGDVIGGEAMMPGNELLVETVGRKELQAGGTVVPN